MKGLDLNIHSFQGLYTKGRGDRICAFFVSYLKKIVSKQTRPSKHRKVVKNICYCFDKSCF